MLVDESLKKNQCALFGHIGKQDTTSSTSKLNILKNDCKLWNLEPR
jgi:hypothetical protein